MFGISGKQAVTITDSAATQIAKLMQSDGHQGLRIGVKKGGCAGMEYTMDYVDDVDPLDGGIGHRYFWPGDKDDVGACVKCCICQCKALQAGAVVADISNRINGLQCWTRGDHDGFFMQVLSTGK